MSQRFDPKTLKDIRLQRKVDLDEFAVWMKTTPERIEKFENGNAIPSIRQLERMALAFKVPFYAFSGDQLPNLEPIPVDYRKRTPTHADLSPAGLNRLWQVEQIADFTNELLICLGENSPTKRRLGPSKVEVFGNPVDLRSRVDDWSAANTKRFSPEKSATRRFTRMFRHYVEVHGCLVSYNDAPAKDYLGFYRRFNSRTPLTFVNRQSGSYKASLFTMAHEWAHYLLDEEGISNPFNSLNSVERRCNRFAAEFLAPKDEFERNFRLHYYEGGDLKELILKLTKNSLLSFQATAIRLQELGLIPRKSISDVFRTINSPADEDNLIDPKPAASGGRINAAAGRKLAEVGMFACYTAYVALERKIIDDVDIAEGLNISVGLQPHVFALAKKRYPTGSV